MEQTKKANVGLWQANVFSGSVESEELGYIDLTVSVNRGQSPKSPKFKFKLNVAGCMYEGGLWEQKGKTSGTIFYVGNVQLDGDSVTQKITVMMFDNSSGVAKNPKSPQYNAVVEVNNEEAFGTPTPEVEEDFASGL